MFKKGDKNSVPSAHPDMSRLTNTLFIARQISQQTGRRDVTGGS
jgi:hypothetical protein